MPKKIVIRKKDRHLQELNLLMEAHWGSLLLEVEDEEALVLKKEKSLDRWQTLLDIVGMIPIVGEPADFVNMLISIRRKDYISAALLGISMIPGLGDAIGKPLRFIYKKFLKGGKGGKLLKKLEPLLPYVNKYGPGIIQKAKDKGIVDALEIKVDKAIDKVSDSKLSPENKESIKNFVKEKGIISKIFDSIVILFKYIESNPELKKAADDAEQKKLPK